MVSDYTSKKHQKIYGFLMFSGDIEKGQCHKMAYLSVSIPSAESFLKSVRKNMKAMLMFMFNFEEFRTMC